VVIAFLFRYCNRIKKDPAKSLTYGMAEKTGEENTSLTMGDFTWRHKICTLVLLIGFGMIIYGSMNWTWSITQFSISFLIMGVLIGMIGGLGVNGTSKAFVKGCTQMVFAGFMIGMARAISVVMTEGRIIDTVVHYMSLPIAATGPVVGANLMYLLNIVVNFIIPSGSGQAVTVMPIMVPLADITGITRQVAVQAFQFGDGFCNCIAPTAGTLMASLGIAGISFEKYAKWFFPCLMVQLVLGAIAITILQTIGWTGL